MAARAETLLLLAAATLLTVVASASAQSSSSDDCTSALVSLSPCLDYISGNDTSAAPSASCCSQLKAVVQSKAQCLCAVLGSDSDSDASSSLGGVTIDRSRALALPKACNVQTPSASQCNGSSSGSSGGGSNKATPSLPSGGGASLRVPAGLVLGLAAAAVYAVAAAA